MKKLAILGSFGSGNLGDEAAWLSVKHFFMQKNLYYKYNTHIFQWGNPHLTCGYHTDVPYIMSDQEIEYFNKEFGALIITGGGIVNEQWGLTKMANFTSFFDKIKVPIYIVSISAEPVEYSQKIIDRVKLLQKKSRIFTVRDKLSQDILAKMNVTAEITPDIVTVMQSAHPQSHSNQLSTKKIIVSASQNCVDPYIKFWRSLYNQIGEADIFPFCPDFNDIYATQAIKNKIGVKFSTPPEMQSLMRECDYVIAGRLHAAVFAANVQTPFFAINYHPKVKSFCDSIGWPYYYPKEDLPKDIIGYGYDYSNFDFQEMLKLFNEFLENIPNPSIEKTAALVLEKIYEDMHSVKPCMYCGEEINLPSSNTYVQCSHCDNVNQNEEARPTIDW